MTFCGPFDRGRMVLKKKQQKREKIVPDDIKSASLLSHIPASTSQIVMWRMRWLMVGGVTRRTSLLLLLLLLLDVFFIFLLRLQTVRFVAQALNLFPLYGRRFLMSFR